MPNLRSILSLPYGMLVCLYLCSTGSAFENDAIPSGGALDPRQAAYDVTGYALHITVNPRTETIAGYVAITFQSLSDTLSLLVVDFIDRYTIRSVTQDHRKLPYARQAHQLLIKPETPFVKDKPTTIRIHYSGQPPVAERPPWSGGFNWSEDSNGVPWVGVSCQGEGAKIWFPCKDHPSDEADSVSLHITVPDSLVCAANGVLESVSAAGPGWMTYHWKTRHPINNYNITVNIADYVVRWRRISLETGPQDSTDIIFYVLKEDTAGADGLLDQTTAMLQFYSRHFGPYPFRDEKFGLAETDYYGMEHQTINSYGNHFKNNELGYDFLLLHEMGHEWWGNYLTAGDWADFWLHEGIDIYAEGMFIEEQYGIDAFHDFFKNSARKRIINQQPIVPPRPATTTDSYGIDVYYKGGYVIRMLRYLLGKNQVHSALKDFVNDPRFTNGNTATTDDFLTLLESRSQRNLDWFYQRYLFKAELPRLDYSVHKAKSETNLQIQWDIPEFPLPVEIEITTGEHTWRERVPVSNTPRTYAYAAGSIISVDPDGWLLYETRKPWWQRIRWMWVGGIAGALLVVAPLLL